MEEALAALLIVEAPRSSAAPLLSHLQSLETQSSNVLTTSYAIVQNAALPSSVRKVALDAIFNHLAPRVHGGSSSTGISSFIKKTFDQSDPDEEQRAVLTVALWDHDPLMALLYHIANNGDGSIPYGPDLRFTALTHLISLARTMYEDAPSQSPRRRKVKDGNVYGATVNENLDEGLTPLADLFSTYPILSFLNAIINDVPQGRWSVPSSSKDDEKDMFRSFAAKAMLEFIARVERVEREHMRVAAEAEEAAGLARARAADNKKGGGGLGTFSSFFSNSAI